MKHRIAWMIALGAWASIAAKPARAQSVARTIEAIDQARVATRILYVTAHPDDESSSLLTYLARGLGAEVALVSVTRGEGGQNAIGPEQGPALAILRTNELWRATRQYGVELFFTRAPDFGYTKSARETLRIWGDIPRQDLVRVIRTFRPDIVINQWGGVHMGHGQHQATGIITPLAVAAAADPNVFPEQLKEGLPAWKVSQVLGIRRGAKLPEEGYRVPLDAISPLWGKTYVELGLKGFANHRSQGITNFLGSPFFYRPVYVAPTNGRPFVPATLAEPLTSLADRFPPLKGAHAALAHVDASLAAARQSALELKWAAAASSLADAGKQMDALDVFPEHRSEEEKVAAWELEGVRARINRALASVAALDWKAMADRSDLVAGESFDVALEWDSRPGAPIQFSAPMLVVPSGWTTEREKNSEPAEEGAGMPSAQFRVQIPRDATPPVSPQDAILPWPEPLVRARLTGTVNGYTFAVEEPVIAKKYTSTHVETLSLELVPAVTLALEPQQIMLPVNRRPGHVELLVRVRYHATRPALVSVGVDAPPGWNYDPIAPIKFPEPGDRMVRFVLTPPARLAKGSYSLEPYARSGPETFRTSLEPLPSLPGRDVSEPAEATAHALDLVVPADLRAGYVAGDNDTIPEQLRQVGIRVDMLDEAALAFGDLRQYDAIILGIRAYELRPDVIHANQRLLDYVAQGGTLVVQYERDFAWNRLLPAPYPARMNQPAERITDENSPVRFVDPSSPLLNFPNKITMADFNGWVQERGLYFWGEFDSRYRAVLAMHDPGEADALGGLVYARYGKGFYIYTGLSFFRQLPAGVPGAYRLFINLLSQSKAAQEHR